MYATRLARCSLARDWGFLQVGMIFGRFDNWFSLDSSVSMMFGCLRAARTQVLFFTLVTQSATHLHVKQKRLARSPHIHIANEFLEPTIIVCAVLAATSVTQVLGPRQGGNDNVQAVNDEKIPYVRSEGIQSQEKPNQPFNQIIQPLQTGRTPFGYFFRSPTEHPVLRL